jgi:hypothetical protein
MRGLIGEGGCVRTADHYRDATASERSRQAVRVNRGRRRRRNGHEVRRRVEANPLHDFIRMRHRVLGRCERRDQRHGELRELNETASAKAPRLRRLRRDQMNAHGEMLQETATIAPNRATPHVETPVSVL